MVNQKTNSHSSIKKTELMRNLLLCWIFTLSIFTSYAQIEASENKKITTTKAYLESAFAGNHKLQETFMHPQIIDYHPTVLLNPSKGKERVIKDWKNSLSTFKSVEYKIISIGLCEFDGDLTGEWVVVYGIINANVEGITKSISYQLTSFYKLENNLIREVRNFGNIMDVYTQMGYKIQAPTKINKNEN